ncbi:hypothetical protein [Natronococcus jeotgali]|uniref:Uncharacterized protein n=1 Tax=Natronococcus jeotgali DSM 18795 TaxID=1227498 RepID=L9XK76_9EURY|nr:hypothetical protein [Natronococcus jeotgali]ELY61982.1 hypothetical protein C492_08675 [Natronococcus jeotgali DSM 18795]
MVTEQRAKQFEPEPLREPSKLMQPERLGALKQTRLSFARLLVDKMVREEWRIKIDRIDLDPQGVGRIVYRIETPSKRFSFGVFSRQSSEGENTDRIIAEEWDMWAFLCEGEATPELMDAQYEELPKVMEGRATPEILIWTRANRSSRFFDHIVESLAAGHQPDINYLSTGGYLMRSSGYYGNGLNGTKVFKAMDGDHPLKRPYMAQMLSAYMLRTVGYDLIERMATARNPDAPDLDRDIKRYLGTGNSSGVGIVMYVVNHPKQLHTWLRAREIALARAKAIEPTAADRERFKDILTDATRWFAEDESETNRFFASKDTIARGLTRIDERLADADGTFRWADLCEWAEANLAMETQEVLHSLLIDTHPQVSEGLASSLTTSEKTDVVPEMPLSTLRSIIDSSYEWALDIDLYEDGARHHFWYRSIENEEPRLGISGESGYEDYALPVDVALQVQQLEADLHRFAGTDTVAEFLFHNPEHRYIVERIQSVHGLSYAEIRANPLDVDFVPLHFISCLKAIWGIQKAHPKSKGWVKGTFFQGAPLPTELEDGADPDWLYPEKPDRADEWGEQ